MAKSKKLSPFARFSKQQIIIALVFILGFGGFGVYKLAFSSAQAPRPPNSMLGSNFYYKVKTADGTTANLSCASVTGSTEFGPIARCTQEKPGDLSRARPGFYSPINNTFNPSGEWLKRDGGSWDSWTCANINNRFFGPSNFLSTGYGPIRYGQIYRPGFGNNVWQIKWAHMSMIDRKCHPTGDWMEAKALMPMK